MKAFQPAGEEEKKKVLKKLEAVSLEQDDSAGNANKPRKTIEMLEANLTEDEMRILNIIHARQMLRSEDTMNIENLAADIIDSRRINLEHGSLGLAKATGAEKKKEQIDGIAMFVSEEDERLTAIGTAERTEVSAS